MIITNDTLNALAKEAKLDHRLRKNICLHSSPSSPAQIMVNHLEPGTEIEIHRHTQTDEILFTINGKSKLIYFNDQGFVSKEFILSLDKTLGIKICKGQWHKLVVLEPTTLIEIKDGPYVPLTNNDIF